MPTSFSKLLSSAKIDDGLLTVDVPDDWTQGRSVFGGLQAALALRAMQALVPGAVLRTLQVTFVAPVPEGATRVRAEILRRGKNTIHVEARIVDQSSTLCTAIGVFGAPRASAVSIALVQPPVNAEGGGVELPYIPGVTPNFTQHFRTKFLRGSFPFTGSTDREQVIDVELIDEGPTTEAHVVAIADFPPPVALSFLTTPAPGSTVTWMMEMFVDRVAQYPLKGWRVDAELLAARDGYTSQAVLVWAPDGSPVAISKQSMLVFG
jgi:acyl-coenzyme A thioesterase PaaI-like protein